MTLKFNSKHVAAAITATVACFAAFKWLEPQQADAVAAALAAIAALFFAPDSDGSN